MKCTRYDNEKTVVASIGPLAGCAAVQHCAPLHLLGMQKNTVYDLRTPSPYLHQVHFCIFWCVCILYLCIFWVCGQQHRCWECKEGVFTISRQNQIFLTVEKSGESTTQVPPPHCIERKRSVKTFWSYASMFWLSAFPLENRESQRVLILFLRSVAPLAMPLHFAAIPM